MALSNADVAKLAEAFRLVMTEAAPKPAAPATPAPATKRKRGGKPAAPKATAKPVAKPATVNVDAETFKGNGCELELRPGSETKNGRKYVLLYVGNVYVGSIRVDDKSYVRAVVNVLRSAAGNDAVAYCDLHG